MADSFGEYELAAKAQHLQAEELRIREAELDVRRRELLLAEIQAGLMVVPDWEKLRAPFTGSDIGKLPKGPKGQAGNGPRCTVCGSKHPVEGYFHVDYVGHAAITERLNSCDPGWRLRKAPIQFDQRGMAYMEAELTVWGVTHEEVGCAETGLSEWPKLLYSDTLTRCGMRFGMALDLWKKIPTGGEVYVPGGSRASSTSPRSGSGASSAARTSGPSLGVLWEDLKNLASTLDAGRDEWEHWKADNDWARVMAANEGKLVESKRQKIEDALRFVREIKANELAAKGEEPWDPLNGVPSSELDAPDPGAADADDAAAEVAREEAERLDDVDGYGGGYG